MSYSAKSQKRYNEKCIIKTIKYKPDEITEYKAINDFLTDNNISFNAYVKQLIRKDMVQKKYL